MKTEELSQLLLRMVESAKENKQVIKSLKNGAIHAQLYELAAEFRDIEVKSFPKSKEQLDAEFLGKTIKSLLASADINIDVDMAWLIFNIVDLYKKKKGKTDINAIQSILDKRREFFTD